MDNIEFIKIYNSYELNNQYWEFKLKTGEWVDCGYGIIDNEFPLETRYKFGLLSDEILDKELKTIEGFYTIDESFDEVLEDYSYHPDDDSFVLIPKEDVIETRFKIKNINKPIIIQTK